MTVLSACAVAPTTGPWVPLTPQCYELNITSSLYELKNIL